MKHLVAVVVVSVALAGCSGEIVSNGLDPDLPPNSEVNGVPYRAKQDYVLELYKKTDKGYVRVNADQTRSMANPDMLYILRQEGKAFADVHTKFELDVDGSLKTVHLDSQQHVGEAATAATQGIDAIVKAQDARDKATEARLGAAEQGELDYVTAINAVSTAEAAVAELPPGASASQRAKAIGDLKAAKVKANIAARKAGVERPYPDL